MQNVPDDGEDEMPRHNNMSAMMKKCCICEKLDEEESQIVTDYIVHHSKKLTLHNVISGVSKLISQFPQKKRHTSFNAAAPVANLADLDRDILDHIWSCVAPLETATRTMIYTSVIMEMLKNAQSSAETAVAVKLLLQTQAAENKK
jgi:hypothetical protein